MEQIGRVSGKVGGDLHIHKAFQPSTKSGVLTKYSFPTCEQAGSYAKSLPLSPQSDSLLPLCQDPYSLNIQKPPEASTVLRQVMRNQIEKVSVNLDLQQVFCPNAVVYQNALAQGINRRNTVRCISEAMLHSMPVHCESYAAKTHQSTIYKGLESSHLTSAVIGNSANSFILHG
ncbi:hypothetical protein RRG08_011463 [Elysia crispata]|uniref:Uncharacterized protein n=1 Tax=Elysia crispata TaxID=231223 RepID=A0AAE0YTR6_9GAST|nr:hypothetical protein RRG08_011463 [Elysia crispata]